MIARPTQATMVEQQELCIDGSGGGSGADADDKIIGGSDSANRIDANSQRDIDVESENLLKKDANDARKIVQIADNHQQSLIEMSPIRSKSVAAVDTSIAKPKKDTKKPHKKDKRTKLNKNKDPEKNDDDEEWELVPPDGGWGWLILGGSMLVNILVPGTVKSFGVLFVEFLEAFDASPATAAWIPALCYFLYSSLGPLSSILSVKYSYRTVTLIGGTFAAVGMMVSYFASSVTYLYISYGLLVGTGAGLSFPPTVYIVTSYFVRLRGLANGICISGSAFGSIILPPILRYLLDNYGYRGAVLIMGGITLNTWVAAIFYEPVENHMKRVLKKKPKLTEEEEEELLMLEDCESLALANAAKGAAGALSTADGGGGGGGGGDNSVIEEEDEGIFVQCTASPTIAQPDDGTAASAASAAATAVKPKFMITSDDSTPLGTPTRTISSNISSPDALSFRVSRQQSPGPNFVRSASAAVVQNYSKATADEHRSRKISTPIREPSGGGASDASFVQQLSSTPSLYAVPESGGGRYSSYSRLSRLNQLRGGVGGGSSSIAAGSTAGERKPKRSPSTSSFQYVSTPYHGSTLSFQPQEFSSHLSLRSIASSINPVGSCSKSKPDDADENGKGKKASGGNKFLDLSLLRDPAYLVVLVSNSTNAIGYTNFIILLPAYAMALGFDKDLSAYLLSIVSALDLVGRIGGSALSDWTEFIPKTWYFVGGLAISGFSLAAMPQATSYGAVSFWCGLFGLASGTYVGITAVIMADMLGTERLTSTYGISLFVNGLLQLVGPPLCGVWLVRAQSYVPLFTTLGCVLMGGASLWGFMPFIHRNRRLKEEKARVARLAFVDNGEDEAGGEHGREMMA